MTQAHLVPTESITALDSQNTLALLRQHLAGAAAHLRRTEIHDAWVKILSPALITLAVLMTMAAIEIAVARLGQSMFVLIPWTAGIGLIIIAGWIARTLLRRRKADWQELAERVDLAVRDQNAIATALDLIRSGDRSTMAARAILDGVRAARSYGSARPVAEQQITLTRKNLYLLSVAAIAIALALWLPWLSSSGGNPSTAKPALAAAAAPWSVAPGQHALVPPANQRETLAGLVATPAQPAGLAGSAPPGAEHSAAASLNAGSASAGESSTARGKTDSSSSPSNPAQEKSQKDMAQPSTPAAAGSSERRPQTAALGSASPDASGSQSVSSAAGAGGESGPSREQPAIQAGNNPAAGSHSSKSPSDQTKAAPGGGEPQSGEKNSGQPAQRGGASNPSGEATGGNGQSGGQNPPKKSRGVAPLMLGTLQPDLLQARQLPGPDDRIKMQAPPLPVPESPADRATAAPRRTDETPVDIYLVPAESRLAVEQYLQQYHQESGPTPAVSN